MDELIARLEKLTRPDRELDWRLQYDFALVVPYGQHLQYTASIDAALTLVPEGFAWSAGSCWLSDDAWVVPDYNSPIYGESLRLRLGEPVKGEWTDSGIDVALHPSSGRVAIAICIAALKARSHTAKGE